MLQTYADNNMNLAMCTSNTLPNPNWHTNYFGLHYYKNNANNAKVLKVTLWK